MHLNRKWKEIPDKDQNVYRPHSSNQPAVEVRTYNCPRGTKPKFRSKVLALIRFSPPSNNIKHNASGRSLSLRKKTTSGSNQIRHIHGHLLHCCIVKGLDVAKNPLVLFSDKVDSNSFSAKTATTANSGERER